MRALAALAATILISGAAPAQVPAPPPAFDCAKAFLPIDHVICSSPDLLKVNDELSAVWRALRERLGEAERQQALDAQRQWIKDYPQACGLPAKGKPPANQLAAAVPCIDKAIRSRTAKLRMQLAELPPPAAAKPTIADTPAAAARWQGAANPLTGDGRIARLAIRDGLGKAAAYQATFLVRRPDGTSWTYHTQAEGGRAEVAFPDDFLTQRQPGAYTYEVLVDLQPALSGAFTLP